MACGVTYEQALAATLQVAPKVFSAGIFNKETKKIAKLLGHKATVRRKFDVDEDTGILEVRQPHVYDSDHYIYLWEGRIIEPMASRQQLWLCASDYLAHYKYQALHLITLTREER